MAHWWWDRPGSARYSVTSDYTVPAVDGVVSADASGSSPLIVTLPPAPTSRSIEITVANVGATGTVTVDASGAETIEGALTYNMTTQWDAVTLESVSGGWIIGGGGGGGGGASVLDDLTDVDTSTTAPLAGQSLVFDGTIWENGYPPVTTAASSAFPTPTPWATANVPSFAKGTGNMDIDVTGCSINWHMNAPVTIATATVTHGNGDPTNPRIDVIQCNPATGAVSIVAGTPAATPTAPAVTAGYIKLAEVAIAANQTLLTGAEVTQANSLNVLHGWDGTEATILCSSTVALPVTANARHVINLDFSFGSFIFGSDDPLKVMQAYCFYYLIDGTETVEDIITDAFTGTNAFTYVRSASTFDILTLRHAGAWAEGAAQPSGSDALSYTPTTSSLTLVAGMACASAEAELEDTMLVSTNRSAVTPYISATYWKF